jgi:hypothetical protein
MPQVAAWGTFVWAGHVRLRVNEIFAGDRVVEMWKAQKPASHIPTTTAAGFYT